MIRRVITIVIVTFTVTVILSDSEGDSYSLILPCGSMRNLGLSYSYGVLRCRVSCLEIYGATSIM